MKYIVKTASAKMPANCWGRYRRVAVIELAEGFTDCPYISGNIKSVKRIVQLWDKCHVGKTDRGEFQRAYKQALVLCDRLNATEGVEHVL